MMKAALPTALLSLLCVAGTAQAAGDATAGEAVFQEFCSDCHTVAPAGSQQKRGPALQGVVGRKAGQVAHFHYSDAMQASGYVWTPERLADFLSDPKNKLPGTRMRLLAEPSARQIEDVIAYLQRGG
jgi:cytochrome c